jgi:hypothetical protein
MSEEKNRILKQQLLNIANELRCNIGDDEFSDYIKNFANSFDSNINSTLNKKLDNDVLRNLFDDLYDAIETESTDVNTTNILHATRIKALANFKKSGYTRVQDGRSKKSAPKKGEVPYDEAADFFNARFLIMAKKRHLIAEEVAKITGLPCEEGKQYPPTESQKSENLKQQIYCLNHYLKTGEFSTNVTRSKQKGYIIKTEVSHPELHMS